MALTFITWLWGNKYGATDLVKLRNAVRRHSHSAHRFCVFVDRDRPDISSDIERHRIKDNSLTGRHCYCRLQMFDPTWQQQYGFQDRIVSLDLDLVITGEIDALFDRPESFVILKGVHTVNPNPFNASIMMLRVGSHPEVWSEFTIERAAGVPFHEFPDDQGWIWHMLPGAGVWNAGKESGVYAFQKPGWPQGWDLPAGARIVSFIGKRKPAMYSSLHWVRKYWG